jgi:MATE family multidrug resistance protein
MGMGMVRAVGPLVSQAVGAEAPAAVGRSVRQGLWLAGGLGLGILLILSNIEPVLRWTGQGPTAIEGATMYLDAIRWGILPFLGFAALRSFVEGLSRPLPVTIIAFIGVGVNIGANELLMFGHWGLPALGLAGTGWASTIVFSALFGLLALFVHCTEPFSTHGVFARLREPDLPTLQELVWVGAPMGASRGVESSLFMVTTVMMGTLGTTALAAHQVALQCAAFAFMVPLGIGMAGTVRVGQAAGAQNAMGARRAGGVAMGLATLFMAGTAVLFWTLPQPIVGLYLDLSDPGNAEVITLAVQLLGVAAVFQLFDGLQVAAHGALQGLKDTRVPMAIAVATYWGIGLMTGYLRGVRGGGGPEALWWGLVAGLAAASVVLLARFPRQVGRAVEEEAVPSGTNGSAPPASSVEVATVDDRPSG